MSTDNTPDTDKYDDKIKLICPAFLGQRLLCFQAAFW